MKLLLRRFGVAGAALAAVFSIPHEARAVPQLNNFQGCIQVSGTD